jgi:hypothetical protein
MIKMPRGLHFYLSLTTPTPLGLAIGPSPKQPFTSKTKPHFTNSRELVGNGGGVSSFLPFSLLTSPPWLQHATGGAILNCIYEPDLHFRVSSGLGKKACVATIVIVVVVVTIVTK